MGWLSLLTGMILAVVSTAVAQPSSPLIPSVGTQDTSGAGSTVSPGSPTVADPLLEQIDRAIQINSQRFMVANANSPWQIFHGILAYKQQLMLKVGEHKMSAIEWVATMEPRFDGLPLILITPHGAKFHPFTREYAFEGHQGQTLALLSESQLPIDFPFKVGDRTVTLADFLNNMLMEINEREEITWVLWALINYLKVDAQWTDQWGRPWSIEKLVQMQVQGPVVGAPCGGNHGLFALVRARDKYRKTGRELRGVWYQADYKINQYIEIARSWQNSDGTFSSDFYRGPGYSPQVITRINTTGHTLEFVAAALPEERLHESWVRRAADVLSRELIEQRKAPLDPGPLYHACHALMIYRQRTRPGPAAQQSVRHADRPASPSGPPMSTLPLTMPGPTNVPQLPAGSRLGTLLDLTTRPSEMRTSGEEPVSGDDPSNR
ncbi:MAG: hypothetical protein KatS3mg114_0521 [Planctomycetaceae bacterium]|nr:MAG: hypothetical protein KatS3mg114_0521 [Planctomycetaceae bacterium]